MSAITGVTKALDGVTTLDPAAVAVPCGSIAASMFTDSFAITGQTIDKSNLVDPRLKGSMFNNGEDSQQLQWLDLESDATIIWMQTAGLPNF